MLRRLMPFNVLSRKAITDFCSLHPKAKAPMSVWYSIVSKTDWTGPEHLKSVFGSVDFLSDDRVVFNIGGNNYRIVARFAYEYKSAMIKFVGTHAEYNVVNATKVGNPNVKQKRTRKGRS